MKSIDYIVRRKEIPISWMRRLGNDEYTTLSDKMWQSADEVLKGVPIFEPILRQLKRVNDELQSMRRVQRGHSSTKDINEWHKKRKALLSGIIVISSNKIKYSMGEDNRDDYIFISNWIRDYGNRLYDLGIEKLSGVVRWMRDDYESNPDFRGAIDACFKSEFAEVLRLSSKIEDAQIGRTKDLIAAKPKRSYLEVRTDMALAWRHLMAALAFDFYDNEETDSLNRLDFLLRFHIAEYKTKLKDRETRRKKRKAAEAELAKVAPVSHKEEKIAKKEPMKLGEQKEELIEKKHTSAKTINVEQVEEQVEDLKLVPCLHKYDVEDNTIAKNNRSTQKQPKKIATACSIIPRNKPHTKVKPMARLRNDIKISLVKWDGKKWHL